MAAVEAASYPRSANRAFAASLMRSRLGVISPVLWSRICARRTSPTTAPADSSLLNTAVILRLRSRGNADNVRRGRGTSETVYMQCLIQLDAPGTAPTNIGIFLQA